MEQLKPQFITVDDYDNYWGESLREILRPFYGNDSYAAERFLARMEIKLMVWIDFKTVRRLRYDRLNPRQLRFFKFALAEQAKYMIINGDLGLDSGYDQEKQTFADQATISNLRVGDTVIEFLSEAGLFNLTVKNLPRYPHGGGYNKDFTNIF